MKKLIGLIIVFGSLNSYASRLTCEMQERKEDTAPGRAETVIIDLEIRSDQSHEYIMVANRRTYLDKKLAKSQVIPVVTQWNSEIVKTKESDELSADHFELDLKSLILTYKYKEASNFLKPKRTIETTKYKCIKN